MHLNKERQKDRKEVKEHHLIRFYPVMAAVHVKERWQNKLLPVMTCNIIISIVSCGVKSNFISLTAVISHVLI